MKHKLCHRTTWTAPEREKDHKHHDGTNRRNPYRNQIDYIITQIQHKNLLMDERSYGGISTDTDHKLVKAKYRIDWWKQKRNGKRSEKINFENLQNPELKIKYQYEIRKAYDDRIPENGNTNANEL